MLSPGEICCCQRIGQSSRDFVYWALIDQFAAVLTAVPLLIGSFALGVYAIPKAAPIHLLYVWDALVVAFLFFWTIGLEVHFYLAYLLWASQMIRNAHDRLMDDFADWFIEAVKQEGDNAEGFRDELRVSFATAFEFIVIGAAHLERTSERCVSA